MNPDYLPGDLVGVQGGFLASLAKRIFTPPTKLYHFLAVRSHLVEENDYEIIEMGMFNCDIGRLSWYNKRYYEVFRLTDPEAEPLGKKAAKYASKFGRRSYDYGVFFRLPLDLLVCWCSQLVKERHIRRIKPNELRFTRNSRFVCTELARAIWLEVGIDPLNKKDVALPGAFIKSVAEGRLKIVGVNLPKKQGMPNRGI